MESIIEQEELVTQCVLCENQACKHPEKCAEISKKLLKCCMCDNTSQLSVVDGRAYCTKGPEPSHFTEFVHKLEPNDKFASVLFDLDGMELGVRMEVARMIPRVVFSVPLSAQEKENLPDKIQQLFALYDKKYLNLLLMLHNELLSEEEPSKGATGK